MRPSAHLPPLRRFVAAALTLVLLAPLSWADAQRSAGDAVSDAMATLYGGDVQGSADLLAQRLVAVPGDDRARFALGGVRTLAALEGLARDVHRFGLGSGSVGEVRMLLPFDVPVNPAPEAVRYQDLRDALERFRTGLLDADATLAPLGELAGSDAGGALQWRIEVGRVRLDLDGDGVPVVAEPERLARALAHLETTAATSRASWTEILAETDDGREWLPNPSQTGVVPAGRGGPPVTVEAEMVDAWFVMLDEIDAVLAGRTLVPYWRVADGRGVNLRRVVLEPRRFDLVLWLQGAAAAPYLEKGEVTDADTWRDIVRAFGGDFATFAFWFN